MVKFTGKTGKKRKEQYKNYFDLMGVLFFGTYGKLPWYCYISLNCAGASKLKSKVGDRPPDVDIFQQRQNKIGQLSRVNGTPLAGVDTNTSKG